MPIIDAGWVTKDGKWVATKDGQRVKCRRKDTTSRERIKKRWEKKLLTQQKVKLKTEAFLWSRQVLIRLKSMHFLLVIS